jgi:serine phosphatase RsbU (regulator of sigma subunit)
VIRTGRVEVYPFLPRGLVDAAAINEQHAEVLRRLGLVSAVVAPLRGRAGVIGAISLAHAESGRRYTTEDVAFLDDLSGRIGMALDTATSFRRQTELLSDVTAIAEAAQLAILAPLPPRIGPIALSARYVSAAEEAHVGGDLYEILEAFGRIRVLIGDVCGKGLPAVRTATIVMGEFRAAATQEPDLDILAKRLDEQLRRWLDDRTFVTACLVDIDADGDFEVVSCGHPPPFHVFGDGWQPVPLVPAPPLGMSYAPPVAHGRLRPGDRLLLYTDGLLEARLPVPGRHFFDPDVLQPFAAHEPFERVLDGILSRLRASTSQQLHDDLALVLVGYAPPDPR